MITNTAMEIKYGYVVERELVLSVCLTSSPAGGTAVRFLSILGLLLVRKSSYRIRLCFPVLLTVTPITSTLLLSLLSPMILLPLPPSGRPFPPMCVYHILLLLRSATKSISQLNKSELSSPVSETQDRYMIWSEHGSSWQCIKVSSFHGIITLNLNTDRQTYHKQKRRNKAVLKGIVHLLFLMMFQRCMLYFFLCGTTNMMFSWMNRLLFSIQI